MEEQDAIPEHRKRRVKTLAMATLTGATVVALALPSVAQAEPEPSPAPPPPPPSGNTFLQGPPRRSERTTAAGRSRRSRACTHRSQCGTAAGRSRRYRACTHRSQCGTAACCRSQRCLQHRLHPSPAGSTTLQAGFSYVVPAGWKVADATQLSYGQALLTKAQPEGATLPGAPQPPNDTSVLLGRLDMRLFAGAEPDNAKAATRLASDMGEFFMPFPGTRINQENTALTAGDMHGAASSYEVKFTDTNKPNGQIWAGVVGNATPTVAPGTPITPRGQRNERWFVVWLGSANNPVDKGAAVALAQSIRPWSPPPPPPPPPEPIAPPDPMRHRRIPMRHRRIRMRRHRGRAWESPSRLTRRTRRRG